MNDEIRISVVIPAYNAEPFLRRSIDSALAQTYKPFEIVLVDDGSTDATASIAKEYGEEVRYIFQNNGGEPVARNTGIDSSKGDWIAFLDADDEWRPHHLMNAVKVLLQHKDLKWYGAPVNQYIHETGKRIYKYVKKEPGILVENAYFADYMNAFPPYAFFAAPTMVVHKSVFEKVALFNPKKHVGCDIDMWFRIGLLFPKVGYCHEPAANVYKRSSSISHTTKKDYRLTLEANKEAEMIAEKVGKEARLRAEPRIMFRITRLLKTSIALGDYQAVREILSTYDKRLAPIWYWLATVFNIIPWAFKPMFKFRNIISSNQRAFVRSGLRSK